MRPKSKMAMPNKDKPSKLQKCEECGWRGEKAFKSKDEPLCYRCRGKLIPGASGRAIGSARLASRETHTVHGELFRSTAFLRRKQNGRKEI